MEDEKGEFPSKSKKVDLSSERAKIRREIARMVNKNKNVKAKKRRFTNSTIIEYVSDEKLEVKLTLKQYHVRQLKRLLAENKRAQEEDANESTAKKRKVGGKGDETQIPSSIEGLPTYGLKMTIKEARGIQRHYDTTYFTIGKIWRGKTQRKSHVWYNKPSPVET